MAIIYDKKNMVFNLQTPETSYVLGIYENKLPIHIHYGRRVEHTSEISDILDFSVNKAEPTSAVMGDFEKQVCLCTLPLEFPTYGSGDFRTPVFHAQYADGSTVSRLFYTGHNIYDGKKPLEGLPSAYVEDASEAQTLELFLEDELTGLKVVVSYTVYNGRDVITRSSRVINGGRSAVKLWNVLSGCIDMFGSDYDFVNFSGAWARERHIQRTPLFRGVQSVESLRGASSHHHNPFVCLASKKADEDSGDVYGINLVYSGNFVSGVYVDTFDRTRLFTGINPFDFEWKLDVGESFSVPECVMVYSDSGFGKLSRTYHELIRERVCRGKFRDKERPVLINNWEATYFDFDEEKILSIAKKASELGVELMVLDDGWFGKRNSDNCSLGDWYVNREKLPEGIEGLAKKINAIGMKFGLWFEPEMISPISDLYDKHPDWCLHTEGRSRGLSRNQLILDLSREDVCSYIIDTLSELLEKANIEYIKWDMNRNMSEIGSAILPPERQREVPHRYMLGLYRILDTLKTKFPNVLLEGCSGGGGRFDMGMFCYFDQFWTSDDSDAVERQYIQTGTSYCYPSMVMGSHVSAVPNHQVGRVTDIRTRGNVAMSGQFGYELDLNTLTDDEVAEVKKQIKLCKELAPVFHKGDMYRIMSPFEGNYTVWEFVAKDKETAVVVICSIKGTPSSPIQPILLKGLDKNAVYRERFTGKEYFGDVLMSVGLKRQTPNDYTSEMLVLEKLK